MQQSLSSPSQHPYPALRFLQTEGWEWRWGWERERRRRDERKGNKRKYIKRRRERHSWFISILPQTWRSLSPTELSPFHKRRRPRNPSRPDAFEAGRQPASSKHGSSPASPLSHPRAQTEIPLFFPALSSKAKFSNMDNRKGQLTAGKLSTLRCEPCIPKSVNELIQTFFPPFFCWYKMKNSQVCGTHYACSKTAHVLCGGRGKIRVSHLVRTALLLVSTLNE